MDTVTQGNTCVTVFLILIGVNVSVDEHTLKKRLSCFYAKVNKRITDYLFHIERFIKDMISKQEETINRVNEFEGIVTDVTESQTQTVERVDEIEEYVNEEIGKLKPAGTYEKIATITVSGDTLPKNITFTTDSDGKAFELESFYVKALIGATDGSSARLTLSVNDFPVFGNASLGSMLSTTPQGWAVYYKDFGENEGALCIGQSLITGSSYPSTPNINNATFTGGVIMPYMTRYKPISKIDFWFNIGSTKTFAAGTKMELWGIRK